MAHDEWIKLSENEKRNYACHVKQSKNVKTSDMK